MWNVAPITDANGVYVIKYNQVNYSLSRIFRLPIMLPLSAIPFDHVPPIQFWRFGLVGNVVGRINEVNRRQARLVLGWVTVGRL